MLQSTGSQRVGHHSEWTATTMPNISGWPKNLFRLFHKLSWKNPNELFGQPNTYFKKPLRKQKPGSEQIYPLCQAALSNFPACIPSKLDKECWPQRRDPGFSHGDCQDPTRGGGSSGSVTERDTSWTSAPRTTGPEGHPNQSEEVGDAHKGSDSFQWFTCPQESFCCFFTFL